MSEDLTKEDGLLAIIDGSKALKKALEATFGDNVLNLALPGAKEAQHQGLSPLNNLAVDQTAAQPGLGQGVCWHRPLRPKSTGHQA